MSSYVFELYDVSISQGGNIVTINNSDSVVGMLDGSELFADGFAPVSVVASDNQNRTITLASNWLGASQQNIRVKVIPIIVNAQVLSALSSVNQALGGALDSIENAVNNRSSFDAHAGKVAIRNESGRLRVNPGVSGDDAVNLLQLDKVSTNASNARQIADATADELDLIATSINALTADPINAVTSIFVPPNAMIRVIGDVTLSAVTSRMAGWLFGTSSCSVSFVFRPPSHWASIRVKFIVANTAANAGDVSLAAEAHNWNIGETINQTPSGSGVVYSVAPQLWVAQAAITSSPIAVDPAGFVTLRIARFSDSTNDTLPNTLALLGVILEKLS